MIDYAYLCQAIADWREGKRPEGPPPPGYDVQPAADAADVVEYEEVQEYEEASSTEYEQAQQGYEQAQQDYEQAQQQQGDGYEQPQQHADGYEQAAEAAPIDEFAGDGDGTQAYAPSGYDATPEYVERTGTPVASEPPVAAPPADDDVDVDVAEIDEIVEDDDDFERDYDLEAIDDFAAFNPDEDLKAYYVANMRMEQAWEDKATRHQLFAEFGIRDEQHFYQLTASVERYIQTEQAQSIYGDLDSIMQLRMNAHMDASMAQQQELAQGELAGDLAPFEEVSLQEWAAAQAQVASGGDVDEIIASMGIDREKWDRVSAEWNARMSRDTTATIATEYGKAFSGAGQGQYGGAAAAGAGAMAPGGDVEGDPPIPLEKWVELEVAQSAGAEQGRDANDVLAEFGMNALEWSNVSAWWSVHFNRHAMEDGQALLNRYNALREQFEAQYSAGDADEDLDF